MRYFALIVFASLAACSAPNPTAIGANPEPLSQQAGAQVETGLRPVIRPDSGLGHAAPLAWVPLIADAATGKPEVTQTTLGTTVASLGNPAEAGLWLKTPLVTKRQPGFVTAADGTKVAVTLIPVDGAATGGSQLSLQAMQALGVSLTSLPEVAVSLT